MTDQTMGVFLLLCFLPSTIFAADLKDLVSASNDFEVEMTELEHVLERNPSATELAASTLKYAKATIRWDRLAGRHVPRSRDR